RRDDNDHRACEAGPGHTKASVCRHTHLEQIPCRRVLTRRCTFRRCVADRAPVKVALAVISPGSRTGVTGNTAQYPVPTSGRRAHAGVRRRTRVAAPGLGDHYLAETGFDSQMTDEPEDRGRPDNLWAPVPGDFGAHGVFDDRAKDTSLQLSVVTSGQ